MSLLMVNKMRSFLRYVNIFWRQSKRVYMVGFGLVQMVKNVYTVMHCHLGLSYKKTKKLLKMKKKKLHWKNISKMRFVILSIINRDTLRNVSTEILLLLRKVSTEILLLLPHYWERVQNMMFFHLLWCNNNRILVKILCNVSVTFICWQACVCILTIKSWNTYDCCFFFINFRENN